MAVQYETIQSEVERLRDYVTNDLNLLVSQRITGNYLAASLITCACDAISYLKYGKPNRGDLFFAELLPTFWSPIARNLYDAIRDGIVHVYETKTIVLGSRRVNIVISLGAKPHLHFSSKGNDLYINVPQLAQDFRDAILLFETELKSNANLRETFYKSMQRDRELHPKQTELESWNHVMSQAPKETT